MSIRIASILGVHEVEYVIRKHISVVPLIRSYPLEKEFGLSHTHRSWLKDYGWIPVDSFKLLRALNWLSKNRGRIDYDLLLLLRPETLQQRFHFPRCNLKNNS